MKSQKIIPKSFETNKINTLLTLKDICKKDLCFKNEIDEIRIFWFRLFLSQPRLLILFVLLKLYRKVIEEIKAEIIAGYSEKEIIHYIRKYPLLSKIEIEEIIMSIKKQRLHSTLKCYRTLSEQSLGVTIRETFVKNVCQKDVPEKLLMKIDIDLALNRLEEFPILKQILIMRYLNQSSIEKIGNNFNYSKTKVYQLLDLALERLVNLIEKGTPQTIQEIRINNLTKKLTQSRTFDDRDWVEKIVTKMYKKAQLNGLI